VSLLGQAGLILLAGFGVSWLGRRRYAAASGQAAVEPPGHD
jgi:hypothetical protein